MRYAVLLYVLLFSSICYGQGAQYEDSIEKRRHQLFGPERLIDVPLVPIKKRIKLVNPFLAVDARSRKYRPAVAFHADYIGGKRNAQFMRDGEASNSYRTHDDLRDKVLTYPAPPIPSPIITTNLVFIPGTNTVPFYSPLLAFIQSGPYINSNGTVGQVGNRITLQHLQNITPYLLAIVPLIQAPGATFNSVLNSPQGLTALAAVQSILQPLNMWNIATLNLWISYVTPRLAHLTNIGLTLYNNLVSALPPGQTVVITVDQPPAVNPFQTMEEINELLAEGDRKEMAERFPKLFKSLIAHLDFNEPLLVLAGSRSGNETSLFPYKPSVIAERRRGKNREVHVISEEGYYVNQYPSGVGRFWQGPDDLTLNYLPITIKDGRIKTLDSIASDLYAWLKRASGGNVRLLDRAATHNTSLAKFDMAFLDDNTAHVRVVGGTTPHSSLGGVMGELEYGSDVGIFTGRIAGGLIHQDMMFRNVSNELVYLETENTLRTPYAEILGPKMDRGFRTWASLTMAVSGLLHKPTGTVIRKGEEVKSRWSLQGEIRLIPELHVQLVAGKTTFGLYGGVTTSIVPGGNLDLVNPSNTLSLYPIRGHVGVDIHVQVDALTSVGVGFVTEWSDLVEKSRFNVRLSIADSAVDFITETERYTYDSITDVRIGGGLSWRGAYLTYLHSLYDDDYRLEVGIDLGDFL